MLPIILMTGGLESTLRGLTQLHVYQNYGNAIIENGGLPLIPSGNERSEERRVGKECL